MSISREEISLLNKISTQNRRKTSSHKRKISNPFEGLYLIETNDGNKVGKNIGNYKEPEENPFLYVDGTTLKIKEKPTIQRELKESDISLAKIYFNRLNQIDPLLAELFRSFPKENEVLEGKLEIYPHNYAFKITHKVSNMLRPESIIYVTAVRSKTIGIYDASIPDGAFYEEFTYKDFKLDLTRLF